MKPHRRLHLTLIRTLTYRILDEELDPEGRVEGSQEIRRVQTPEEPGVEADRVRIPVASAPFTPISDVYDVEPKLVSPEPAVSRFRAESSHEEGLGDFLDSLRDEGSSALSSHQWGAR